MVNWENYEEYMLLDVDGELNAAEHKALMDFLQLHPALQDELKQYQSAVLQPEPLPVYENKDALIRPVPSGRVISLRQWWSYGAAAGLVLLVIVMASKWSERGGADTSHNPDLAKNEVYPKDTVSVVKHQNMEHKQTQPSINVPVIRQEAGRSIARHSVHSNPAAITKEKPASDMTELRTVNPASPRLDIAPAELASLAPVDVQPIGNMEIAPENTNEEKGFLAWLPVDSEKKEGLRGLKNNIASRVEQAKHLPETIRETALELKIGNKEFTINF